LVQGTLDLLLLKMLALEPLYFPVWFVIRLPSAWDGFALSETAGSHMAIASFTRILPGSRCAVVI
jgi:hypothetical protein